MKLQEALEIYEKRANSSYRQLMIAEKNGWKNYIAKYKEQYTDAMTAIAEVKMEMISK